MSRKADIYQVTLRATFYGFVYVFDAALGCGFASMQTACSRDGVSGDISHIVNSNTTATFEFQHGFSEEAVLAVHSDTSAGPFELESSACDLRDPRSNVLNAQA